MHAGRRACAIRTAGWLDSGTAAGTAMAEPLDTGGATCWRDASFTATTLQQGARSSAASLASPLLAQQASGCAEAHQSAARTGRVAEPTSTLTAKATASRRIGRILLGFPFPGNSNGIAKASPLGGTFMREPVAEAKLRGTCAGSRSPSAPPAAAYCWL